MSDEKESAVRIQVPGSRFQGAAAPGDQLTSPDPASSRPSGPSSLITRDSSRSAVSELGRSPLEGRCHCLLQR
jgi:hypothetical protein